MQDFDDKDIVKEWEDGEQKIWVKEDTRLEHTSGSEKRKRLTETQAVEGSEAEAAVQAKFRKASDASDPFFTGIGGQVFRAGAASGGAATPSSGIGFAHQAASGSGAWDQLFGRGVAPQVHKTVGALDGLGGALGNLPPPAAAGTEPATNPLDSTPSKLTPVQFVTVKREKVNELAGLLDQVAGSKGSFARLEKIAADKTVEQGIKDEVQLQEHIDTYKKVFDKLSAKVDDLKKSTLKSWSATCEDLDDLIVEVAEGMSESQQMLNVFSDVEQLAKKEGDKIRQRDLYKLRKTAGLLTSGNFPPELAKQMAKYAQMEGSTEDIQVDPAMDQIVLQGSIIKFTSASENEKRKLIVEHMATAAKAKARLHIFLPLPF